MKFVIFGLTISSSWGNGHATIWRGLCDALAKRRHTIIFFEKDVPWYSSHRDLWEPAGAKLILYTCWQDVLPSAEAHLRDTDVAIVTSYCPDALTASDLVLSSRARIRVFYDLDTPVTLDGLRQGRDVAYIGPRGLQDFDLVLSYTGGIALSGLKELLGARKVAPLYGSVDPAVHRPVPAGTGGLVDLSYLGTYAEDRHAALNALFLEPARMLPGFRFRIGGSLYPETFPWAENIFYIPHVAPSDHPAFYCSSRLTLNVTRRAMAQMGYCPSGRLFEAAACRVPIVSDWWEGLDHFFEPGREVIIAQTSEDTIRALKMHPERLSGIGRAARERALEFHTAECRARELERIILSTESGLCGA